MMHAKNRFRVLPLALAMAAFAACDGSNSTVGQVGPGGNLTLEKVQYGRLVDVFSYRRIDVSKSDRRLRANRRLELIAKNVVVNANIGTQSVFDAAGRENPAADYEFLRFNKDVGHEQLVILWDNSIGEEQARFDAALSSAQDGLEDLPASYRGQSTAIPLVPRNAAIKLEFSNRVDLTEEFLLANPSAIQLLEFKGDPNVVDPADAFRILPYRPVVSGDSIILDTTVLGGEASGGITTSGLPQSADSVTANIRVAIPQRGSVVSSFYVNQDRVKDLNDVDSARRDSIIRDFRSGNLDDDGGRLAEPDVPQIVGAMAMGITAVDPDTNTITLNKRNNFVPVRGRYPFVDGPLGNDADRTPAGPLAVPTQRPLTSGDILVQDVTVLLSDGSFEVVTLRAEILENLRVNTAAGTPGIGRALNQSLDGVQGELAPSVTVRVATVAPTLDSERRPVSFEVQTDPNTGLPFPNGTDCTLRTFYVEQVPFLDGNGAVSDATWRNRFVRIEPATAQPGINVDPNASISIEFTKPMDLDQVDSTRNLLVTNTHVSTESFAQQMTNPKDATARIVPTRLTDLLGDGTVLRLQPPLGFAHAANVAETYSVHVRLGAGGVIDLAGSPVEVFDDIANPQDSWSVDFSIAPSANRNHVGWHVYAFEAADEDGTLPGSIDMFGQFRLQNGRLTAAEGVRFSRSANSQTLAPISRITRGECWNGTALVLPVSPPMGDGWVPAHPITGAPHPGQLYWDVEIRDLTPPPPPPPPFGFDPTIQHPIGRVIEPLKPQGSRMQMRYIEDDFTLSYRAPSDFMLDVEQLYWSPFNDEEAMFDQFDRTTMRLAHARKRGDELWTLNTDGECVMDCASMDSGLDATFADNVLQGTSLTPVFQDRMYTVNPNEAVVDNTSQKFIPYPRFDRSYTWRDSRLVTIDDEGNVIGLGGSQNPDAATNNDRTADIDSPWITSTPVQAFLEAGFSTFVVDRGDFGGENQRDHDPIALPLLVDIMVFPDDASNGSAQGGNGFQVATLGATDGFGAPAQSGYYDSAPSGCGGLRPAWPRLRVHTSGGFDLISQDEVRIDPANATVALGSVNKDVGLGAPATGLFQAPPGDGMLNWARADFVRKVSTATFGFFDTLRPQLYHAVGADGNAEGTPRFGFPDWSETEGALRVDNLVVQIDPPQSRQPAGTSVVVELRGVEGFGNDGTDQPTPQDVLPSIYNPTYGDAANDRIPGDLVDVDDPDSATDTFGRGNLYNPNFSCEAFRYSTANLDGGQRVQIDGLTRYVTEDQIDEIRNPATGLLPRFMNVRLVMTNNNDVVPSLSPSLRSMSVTYRLLPSQN